MIAGEVKDSNRKGRKVRLEVGKGSVAMFFAIFASSSRALQLKALKAWLYYLLFSRVRSCCRHAAILEDSGSNSSRTVSA